MGIHVRIRITTRALIRFTRASDFTMVRGFTTAAALFSASGAFRAFGSRPLAYPRGSEMLTSEPRRSRSGRWDYSGERKVVMRKLIVLLVSLGLAATCFAQRGGSRGRGGGGRGFGG